MRFLGCTAVTLITLTLVSCGDDNVAPSNPTPTNPIPAPNQSPTAAFAPSCSLLGCTFTDASTDDGAVTAWRWDFGDGSAPSAEQSPVHTYGSAGRYRVTLRVTDNAGATGLAFWDIAVQDLSCSNPATPDDFLHCVIDVPNGNAISVTISSESDCTTDGDTLRIVAPIDENVFTDGCHPPKDVPILLNQGNCLFCSTVDGCPLPLYVAITLASDDPNRTAPSIHQEGGYPQWTIRLEDGGHPTDLNEPDFNDLVVTITATPPPPDPWGY